jgi:hypothetical protein
MKVYNKSKQTNQNPADCFLIAHFNRQIKTHCHIQVHY